MSSSSDLTVSLDNLRKDWPTACRSVFRRRVRYKATYYGDPVVELIHPDLTPQSKEIRRLGVTAARDELNELWETLAEQGGHVKIMFHGKPRAVMVPYVEPEAA